MMNSQNKKIVMFYNRAFSYIFVRFFKIFPKTYKCSWLRKFFTRNFTSGLLAVGECFRRFEAIGPRWIYLDQSDCDFPLEFRADKRLPFSDNSQRIIYSSHMIEHLTPASLESFIKECFRILKPGGYIRFEAPCAEKLITAYRANNRPLIEYFRDDLRSNLIPELQLDVKYGEDHVGILGVLACYIERGRHVPVYVEKKIFDEKILSQPSLSLEEIESWLQLLQTHEQKETNGHNNLVYFQKLQRICKKYGASACWQESYNVTQIPRLYLNNVYRRHKDTIIEGPHRTEYSIYFEAQKAC